MSVITLTTDFGVGSPYAAAMKGVILSINPRATVVDVTHGVRPQDVRQAALILDDVTGHFPPESIHVAVVDPGVGTDRAILYARVGYRQFIAPDNGLLSRVLRRPMPSKILRISDPQHWLKPVSATFHGRDVMAPVAARLSTGLDPQELGPPLENPVMLDWPQPVVSPGKIEGEVLDVDSFGNLTTNVDSFGNLTTNVEAELLAAIPDKQHAWVEVAGQKTRGIRSTYGDASPNALIALVGSSGRLELAIVGGNAATTLGAAVGAAVTVRWE